MEIETPKSLEQPKSVEIVASVDDLLSEILLHLPVEPLIRCKIVSKRWHSLISSSTFRRRRNLNAVPAVGLFVPSPIFEEDGSYNYIPFIPQNSVTAPFSRLDFTRHRHCMSIIQSCNGLLLCHRRYSGGLVTFDVYNPTENKFSTLPKVTEDTTTIRGMSLAFDPTKSPYHYKVVCVREVSTRYQIEVYSSKTGAWRTWGEPFTANVDFDYGVYWNNSIHWIFLRREDGESLYFNVHRHVLEKMPNLPALDVESGVSSYYLGQSCDHLHYVEQLYGEQTQFNVYEMKRDYSEWFVKYRVDLSPVVPANYMMIRADSCWAAWDSFYLDVISVVRGEEDDGSFLVVRILGLGEVIRYNLVSKTFEKLNEFFGAEIQEFIRFLSTEGFQCPDSFFCV